MVQCPNCGAMNPESSEVCAQCGRILAGSQVVVHEAPKLPFIKRIPPRRGLVRPR